MSRHHTAILLLLYLPLAAQQGPPATTALRGGTFQMDLPHVVGRSDIVLERPNTLPEQAMPLGNGSLGVALWAADGLTAQLNRADTMPNRYSTGQVVLPGLAALTQAHDYGGRLNLYRGTFEEHGAGVTLNAYVQPGSDTLVLDVTGADPRQPQKAILKLWEPRSPTATAFAHTGMLTQTWRDDKNPGFSGRTFGSLSAITGEGRNLSVAVTDSRTVTLTVTPFADGHFRIFIASPHYTGATDAATQTLVTRTLAARESASHTAWWQSLWQRATLLKITSPDGTGEYLENLRTLYIYSAAAQGKGEHPASQAGVADLFSSSRDEHKWDPAAFWHWNLRMMTGANLGAGLPELNLPYFALYRQNLGSLETWTRQHMQGAPGICIPETMRFNGPGIEYETWIGDGKSVSGWNCDAASGPYYNARTLSTGAEVSLWIWQQYLATGDLIFLRQNYPVMAAAAQFLMAYEKPGPDGLLHTSPSNAHETQWDVTDPTTDLAARQALYSTLIQAATLLHRDPALVRKLQSELLLIPELPRTLPVPPAGPGELPRSAAVLLSASDDSASNDVLANSRKPMESIHNIENIGLEPVWPYNLIGDTSPLFALARRTFLERPNRDNIDWSFDPVHAARLGLGEEVARSLVSITESNQRYINGFARWGTAAGEFYLEQIGVATLALNEALVQDYDGILRIAPAVPAQWAMEGTVAVRKRTRVSVQVRDGIPSTILLTTQIPQTIRMRNPAPGQAFRVVDARSGALALRATSTALLIFPAAAGHTYKIERVSATPLPFAAIDGVPATHARKLGPVQVGLEATP